METMARGTAGPSAAAIEPSQGPPAGFKDVLPGVPAFESPFYGLPGYERPIKPQHRAVADSLREHGYAVIDFPDPDFDRRAQAIRDDLDGRFDWAAWRGGGYERNEGLRVQDAWKTNADVKAVAANPALLDLLSDVYGRGVKPFQTLNFPVGTQQGAHSDASHFSSMPERFMCGVWVALEDITEGAGPLVYYPGTHRMPTYGNEQFGVTALDWKRGNAYDPFWNTYAEAHKLQPERFLARKGQALIWVANIVHGGSRQTDPNCTRWSQVTHYYFEGCAYYTPFFSDPFHGNVYFRSPIDIRTEEPMENVVGGRPVDPGFMRDATERAQALIGGNTPSYDDPFAERRAYYEDRLAQAEAQLKNAQDLADFQLGRVDRMKASLSWRMTAPLRRLGARR